MLRRVHVVINESDCIKLNYLLYVRIMSDGQSVNFYLFYSVYGMCPESIVRYLFRPKET
jgi:hypothetical protein